MSRTATPYTQVPTARRSILSRTSRTSTPDTRKNTMSRTSRSASFEDTSGLQLRIVFALRPGFGILAGAVRSMNQ